MLLRHLWSKKQKVGWNDIVSEEYQTLWYALSHDLAKLDSLKFLRFVTSEDSPADFYIFCDAFLGADGFAVYSVAEPINTSTLQIVLVKRASNDSQKNNDGNKGQITV